MVADQDEKEPKMLEGLDPPNRPRTEVKFSAYAREAKPDRGCGVVDELAGAVP